MKRRICMVLAAGMLLSMLAGCAKEQEALPGLPPATETLEVAQQKAKEAYEIPDRFTGEWTGLEDIIHVTADAEILLPEDMGKLCTARVERHAFTQEEADKILEVFLKGNPLYEEVYLTKERCQEIIDKYEAILRGEAEYTGDGTIDRVPGLIKLYKEELEKVPYAEEKPLADTQFHHPEPPMGATGGDYPNYEIKGYADVDGRTLHVSFNDCGDTHYWEDEVWIWEEGYGGMNGAPLITWDSIDARNNFKPVSMDGYAEALAVGEGLMEELGLEEFICDGVIPVEYAKEIVIDNCYTPVATGENGVLLEYVRKVNGLPLTKTNFDGSARESGAPDIGNWCYEKISVYVLGDRVVCFNWWNPYEVTNIRSAGEMMDFQDIQEIFGKMIFVKNNEWLGVNQANGFDDYHELHIDKVQLTLMRVRPRDSVTEGTIVPVWDFWGTEEWYRETGEKVREPDYGVQLTLNALDGTLIDREIGY